MSLIADNNVKLDFGEELLWPDEHFIADDEHWVQLSLEKFLRECTVDHCTDYCNNLLVPVDVSDMEYIVTAWGYLLQSDAIVVQWNPSIAATLGEQHFGRYTGVAFIEGLFCTQTVCLGPGCLRGRYIAVGLYSGVAVKRGSTVLGAKHSIIMRLLK